MPAGRGQDELLRRSIGSESARAPLPAGERPWRLSSQGYVAFFGGPLGAAVIAYLNAGRLRMDSRSKLLIVLAGVVGMAILIGLVIAVGDRSGPTVIARVLGLLAWAPMYFLQRTPDRVHSFYSGRSHEEDYDSLVGPGVAVAVLFGVSQAFALAALVESE